jgi:FAD/FMN-containing dehydrogenase
MNTEKPRRRRKWPWIVGGIVLVLLVPIAWPAWRLIRTAWRDVDAIGELPPGYIDDASRLNPTHVAEVWDMPTERERAERELADLLDRARRENLRVSIAGARHSMGGQTIYPEGINVNMLPWCGMELDRERKILHVQSGARWSQVIEYLDARGLSVAIMQSNNDFSVGGSISVNCHGWQPNRPPIASTVESLRVMTADGTIQRASREDNAELFSLVLGGYGLFGVILDVDLRVVPNERYRLEQEVLPPGRFVARLKEEVVDRENVGLAYGRLCVVPDKFLQEGILSVLYRDPAADGSIPPLSEPALSSVKRTVFRGSAEDDYGKALRWDAEKNLLAHLSGPYFSRNQLLNESAVLFQNRSAESTDVLHEYFVPPENFAAFLAQMRSIIPRHEGNLLNVTVRMVSADPDTVLRYARTDVLALVMLFMQPRTPDADVRMKGMTRELIDAALDRGGSYYLPYRLHATREQFARAYPEGRRFFDLKRQYDPDELFQNRFYMAYGEP